MSTRAESTTDRSSSAPAPLQQPGGAPGPPGVVAREVKAAGGPSAARDGVFPRDRAPEVVPQRGGPTPIWRSLLSPRPGQRALALCPQAFRIFESLSQEGVLVEWDADGAPARGRKAFDLVLEDWSLRRTTGRPARVHPLLSPGGRWVAVMEAPRFVGWSARAALLQAHRERFERVETYYAHPSLQAPQILVPLDRPEPILYFLSLAVGVRTARQRILNLGLRTLWKLGIHREALPNLIIVARRKK